MVVYKRILTPSIAKGAVLKPEDNDPVALNYILIDYLSLDRTYSQVFLKTIRFNLVYRPPVTEVRFHPYQVHLQWLDNSLSTTIQPGRIVQNTQRMSPAVILYESDMDTYVPSYSTFCQFESSILIDEPLGASEFNDGPQLWICYNMERNALVREGSFSFLNFQIYFTNLRGQQYMSYLPNVEVEFELF